MLPNQSSPVRLSLLACLLALLSACSDYKAIEGWFAADPKLKDNPEVIDSPSVNPQNEVPAKLPDDFPREIPRYREAQLLNVEPESTAEQGKARWTSPDPSNLIENFYQKEFQSNNWEIVKPLSPKADNPDGTLVARRDNLQVTVSIVSPSAASDNFGKSTEFAIEYQRDNSIAQSEIEQSEIEQSETEESETEQSETEQSETEQSEIEQSKQPPIPSESKLLFSDLDLVPEQSRRYVEDLAALGILTSNQNDSQIQGKKFEPNQIIKRRDYARWLVAANNRIYANQAGKQIRLVSKTAQPAFQDVGTTDPDFAVIQGLAEAGLIPSPLSGDSTAVLFRPEAPLTREDLIFWKVPLDIRQGLPSASLDAVKETWGFQDAAKIDPKALRSLYADFQNGEQANVRRVLGYTTLFQPKKPVTRAEAAAALWYFGYQGEGISAKEALQLNRNE